MASTESGKFNRPKKDESETNPEHVARMAAEPPKEDDSPRRVVAIVGRPNVGKSALFNRLAGERIAIVHDQPGITRDRIVAECNLGEAPFEIIDTGGIGEIADAEFHDRVRAEAEIAVQAAAVVVFTVDGRAGLVPADQDLAKYLRRSRATVLLVVNKIDLTKHEPLMAEFARLGFRDMFNVSAAHGRGISDLVEAIEAKLPNAAPVLEDLEPADPDAPATPRVRQRSAPRIAILGRPNVGKSSLTNAILKDERTIVSDTAGTTRDAVDIPHVFNGRPYVLIDTAGMRHRSRHNSSAEVFSVMRSEKSVHRADLCVLVVDAEAGVTRMDRQIAGLIQEAKKPCVLLLNKWDLIDKAEEGKTLKEFRKEFLDSAAAELFFLDHAPLIAISAKEKMGIGKVFMAVEEIRAAALAPTPTGPLNRLLQTAMEHQPPRTVFNKRFKLLYATRTNDELAPTPIPVPRFIFFCNDERLLTADYRRYLEKSIRKEYPFPGLPITIRLRGREKAK